MRVIVSLPREPGDLALRWSGRISLTPRILAVNILALALLAGSLFYLDGYRSRLIDERMARAKRETQLVALALAAAPLAKRAALISNYGQLTNARLRIFDAKGRLISDSWPRTKLDFELRDLQYPLWQQNAAKWLDIAIDFVVGAVVPPPFSGFETGKTMKPNQAFLSFSTDRTHIISAASVLPVPVPGDANMRVVSDRNARDIRQIVRAERARLGIIVGIAAVLSVLLSLFLARTIVRPLRKLARAAVRVRLGRSREVIIPRLPSRRDEIGMLARAISDMSHALRQRIDATEAFAADVAHELKNPLASMRSAVDSLGIVKDPALHTQLLDIVRDDVRRLDRLINDISDLSRLDAKLSRARFELVDIVALIDASITLRETRAGAETVQITLTTSLETPVYVRGDGAQLTRVVENLLDNALSFSPPASTITLGITRQGDDIILNVDDEGPGIAEHLRQSVFDRFHSDRPVGEAFGQHSGLGLAIARTIVNGHNGTIEALANPHHGHGARLLIRLPAAAEE